MEIVDGHVPNENTTRANTVGTGPQREREDPRTVPGAGAVDHHTPCGASGHLSQAPFQPRAAQNLSRQVHGGQYGEHSEKCPLGGRRAMQVVKTAEHIKAPHAE